MKKINKTEEYEKLRKVAEEAGMNQYDAAAAAMEMVLHPIPTKGICWTLDTESEQLKQALERR